MDADNFFYDVRNFIESQFKSSFDLSIRPRNDCIYVTFRDQYDFVTAVLAAAGANIRTVVIGIFGEHISGNRNIESCCLKLELSSEGMDIRLLHFMYEVLNLMVRDNKVSKKEFEEQMSNLRQYESWLDESPSIQGRKA